MLTQTSVCRPNFLLFVQFMELAFIMYEGYLYYAAILLAISLVSGYVSTMAAYQMKLQLYTSIAQHHLVPRVLGRYVR